MAEGRLSTPTRSAYLELRDERRLVREGYEFLDEKRMVVAQQMLRELAAWREQRARWGRLHREAIQALRAAVARHGLDGLSVYPAPPPLAWKPRLLRRRFLGIELLEAGDTEAEPGPAAAAVLPSSEAERCRAAFAALVAQAARLGVHAANLRRLVREYRRTERRARALENVLLPELDRDLSFMEEQLDALEQEEALRVRLAGRGGGGMAPGGAAPPRSGTDPGGA